MEINKDTSYLIGFFQTDGNVYETTRNRGKASIEISIKDEDIIEKIKELIPYNYTITKRIRKTKFGNCLYEKETISIKICDMNFRKFLKDSGVPSGKKSDFIKPPLHLENLSIPDYIRGLYDGDGSLGMTGKNIPYVSFVTKSTDIANFLFDYLEKMTGKQRKINNPNKRDNAYNIMINKEDAIIFCNEIYYDGCLSINRKQIKAEIIKKWKRPDNMKKLEQRNIWSKKEDNIILNNSIIDSVQILNRSKNSIEMRLYRLKKGEKNYV